MVKQLALGWDSLGLSLFLLLVVMWPSPVSPRLSSSDPFPGKMGRTECLPRGIVRIQSGPQCRAHIAQPSKLRHFLALSIVSDEVTKTLLQSKISECSKIKNSKLSSQWLWGVSPSTTPVGSCDFTTALLLNTAHRRPKILPKIPWLMMWNYGTLDIRLFLLSEFSLLVVTQSSN